MAQRHQNLTTTSSAGNWLASLVDTFERTEQLGSVPCDEKLISVVRARLERPALPARTAVAQRRKRQFQPQL